MALMNGMCEIYKKQFTIDMLSKHFWSYYGVIYIIRFQISLYTKETYNIACSTNLYVQHRRSLMEKKLRKI